MSIGFSAVAHLDIQPDPEAKARNGQSCEPNVSRTEGAAHVWHTWSLLRIGFCRWTGNAETDEGSVPPDSLTCRFLLEPGPKWYA